MVPCVLSSLVEVVCCDIIHFTQLMGSRFVVGLLFFGVYIWSAFRCIE